MAQNTSAFRQFYFNPYLYNPAFAGIQDHAQVSLLYRQQWVGFNNAPSTAGFTLLLPSRNRTSFGLSVLSQEVVALQTNTAQATFAYRVPIRANQFLFFGISGVAGTNQLKLDADYSNDPAILNAAANTFYADANFGMMYSLGQFRLGFALPKLLGQKYYSPQDLVNVRYAQWRNQLYSLSYKIRVGDFSFEPYALYRINRDLQNWWEASTIAYFKEKIWLGASYNSTQGLGFFLGFDMKEKLRVGYSYELPPSGHEFINTSSHEIHLQLKLGKRKIFKWAARFSAPENEQAEVSNSITQPSTEAARGRVEMEEKPIEVIKTEPVIESIKDTVVMHQPVQGELKPILSEPITKPAVKDTLVSGLYVVAGTFKEINNARSLKKNLTQLGFEEVEMAIHPQNGLFHVYIFSSYHVEECLRFIDRFKQRPKVWILRVK